VSGEPSLIVEVMTGGGVGKAAPPQRWYEQIQLREVHEDRSTSIHALCGTHHTDPLYYRMTVTCVSRTAAFQSL